MTWRRNTAGSFLLPVSFYNYVDASGTDTTQWKILKVPFFFSVHTIYLIHAFSSCIMIKYSHLSNLSLKHSTTVLSNATSSRLILKSIIPGLKDNVNYMIVTSITFLDLDLFHSLDYDSE